MGRRKVRRRRDPDLVTRQPRIPQQQPDSTQSDAASELPRRNNDGGREALESSWKYYTTGSGDKQRLLALLHWVQSYFKAPPAKEGLDAILQLNERLELVQPHRQVSRFSVREILGGQHFFDIFGGVQLVNILKKIAVPSKTPS